MTAAIHIVSARLESRGIPAAALSKIFTRSETMGWEPIVEYEFGPGRTLTFDVRAETIDELAAVLREITDAIAEAELNN